MPDSLFENLTPEDNAELTILMAEELTGALSTARLASVFEDPACTPELRRAVLMTLNPASLTLITVRGNTHDDKNRIITLVTLMISDLAGVADQIFEESCRLTNLANLTPAQADVLRRLGALNSRKHLSDAFLIVKIREAVVEHWGKGHLRAPALATVGTDCPELIGDLASLLDGPTDRSMFSRIFGLMAAVRTVTGAPKPDADKSRRFSNGLALVVLKRLSARDALSADEQLDWDDAADRLELNQDDADTYYSDRRDASRNDVARLARVLARVRFDPGNLPKLRALGNAAHQTLLAGCPGVPAGRVKITSVSAARIAVLRLTPSAAAVLRQKTFQALHAADPALTLEQAIAFAVNLGDADGLCHRQMSTEEHLQCYLQTENLELRNAISWPRKSAFEKEPALLQATVSSVVNNPTRAGLDMLRALSELLSARQRIHVSLLCDLHFPYDTRTTPLIVAGDLEAARTWLIGED